MALVGPNIEDLVSYQAGKPIEDLQRELGILDPVKLASNENALGPSPAALAVLRESASHLHRYPDPAGRRLKERVARLHGVTTAQIVLGSGSNELIELAVRTFVSGTEEGLVSKGTFVAYERAFQSQNVPYQTVPMAGTAQDLAALAAAAGPRTKIIFLANPNNPTGGAATREQVATFLSAIPRHVVVVLDEAYAEYARAEAFGSALALTQHHPQLLVLRTFSKIHGLAGLRVGYGVGPAPMIEYLDRVRMPFNASSAAQAAALAALDDEDHVARSRALVRDEEPRLRRALTELGLDVAPSEANFLFIDVRRDGEATFQALLQRGVIVRPMRPYGFPTHLRVTIGTARENDRFLAALREVLA
jgi:histidinol-phosphate aminotransferase